MPIVPIMRCSDMARSIDFYTRILDFRLKYPEDGPDEAVVSLEREGAELQLSVIDGVYRNPVNVFVDEVDQLFQFYIDRGLDSSKKRESPVHQSPVDQTWGRREFYVDDPDGNTLRFCTWF